MSNSSLTGLYDPAFKKDSCGFGMIANIDDVPSHWLVKTSIEALARLTHRGAVGLVFISPLEDETEASQAVITEKIAAQGLEVAGWREMPIDKTACGEGALKSLPAIFHIYVNAADALSCAEFNRSLYLARRVAGHAFEAQDNRRIEEYYY